MDPVKTMMYDYPLLCSVVTKSHISSPQSMAIYIGLRYKQQTEVTRVSLQATDKNCAYLF